jgi:cell division protein FtsI (penicillin-binding protein 3)
MRTFYENDIRKRTLLLALGFGVWFIVVLYQLIQLQVLSHGRLKTAVIEQNQSKRTIQPKRGNIFDRNGALLACSVPATSIGFRRGREDTPAQVTSKIHVLRKALDLSSRRTSEINRVLSSNVRFTFVKRQATEEEVARVAALDMPNVSFERENKRYYPKGKLAAHLLRWVRRDGLGSDGLELMFDDFLKGQEGEQIVFVDKNQTEYQTVILQDPVPGRDITLTIDETIQYIAEKEITRAIQENDASWGTVIVLDPFTGDVLAMASAPSFDLNAPGTNPDIWRNRAVQENFEPGSTFKIVAAASALENGAVRFADVFDCREGAILVGGRPITDHHRMGILTFPQVIIESSNVGTAQFAMKLGPDDFHETIRKFGFGRKTGSGLPGEEKGVVHPPRDWNPIYSLPHIAIGYEVMATALQIVRAMNVFATRGWLVTPRLVLTPEATAAVPDLQTPPPIKILDENIAAELVSRVFEKVVEEGTAETARLEEYRIAGKTGTARKYVNALGRYTSKYVASFVGFVPVEEPRLSMIVVLDEPKKVNFFYGGQVAAPVFRDIARQVLRYLKVKPDRPFGNTIITAEPQEGPSS